MENYVIEEYMYLKKDKDHSFSFCDEEECTFVCVPKGEFRGLKKTLSIVNNRARQQIEKSKADKNGFRVMRADERYCSKLNGMLWYVTKQTPYSIKLSLQEVLFMAKQTLKEQYTFISDVDLGKFYLDSEKEKNAGKVMATRISGQWMPKAAEQWSDEVFRSERDFLVQNNDTGRALYRAFAQFEGLFIIGIAGISQNYAQGVYEISYWATAAI